MSHRTFRKVLAAETMSSARSSSSFPIKRAVPKTLSEKNRGKQRETEEEKEKKGPVGFPRFSFFFIATFRHVLPKRMAAVQSKREIRFIFIPASFSPRPLDKWPRGRYIKAKSHRGKCGKTAAMPVARLFVSSRVFYQNLDRELCPSATIIASRVN